MVDMYEYLRTILTESKTVAAVGLSSNPMKESYHIDEYLHQVGYDIIPVNPTVEEIFGKKAYPDLPSVPVTPDVVQIFRRPEDTMPIVEQAIEKGAKTVWFQVGTAHPDSAKRAREAGLKVVENLCMRVMHRMLLGH